MRQESKKKIEKKVEKAEQEKSKAAGLSEQELDKVAGGNVAAKWNVSQGSAA